MCIFKHFFKPVAMSIINTPQREEISAEDAWGVTHRWVIEWQADDVTRDDDSWPNVNQLVVVWADTCPVTAGRERGGPGVDLFAQPVSADGYLATPIRVDTPEEMGPGRWRIVESSD